MHFYSTEDCLFQEISEQKEQIEQLEKQLSELLDLALKLQQQLIQRRQSLQDLLFQADPNSQGEILSLADLLI